jgi:hypothetical protein
MLYIKYYGGYTGYPKRISADKILVDCFWRLGYEKIIYYGVVFGYYACS